MSRAAPWLVAAIALTIFIVLTVTVTTGGLSALDSSAFTVTGDVHAPWLTRAAQVVTTLGLLAVVGPAVAIGAVVLIRCGQLPRAFALAAGATLTSLAVWLTKALVDRPRPPRPLVHTAGQSYPSAHAANSIGWIALALALGAVIPFRAGRVAAVSAGTLLAALVGLSRVYLRAHYLTDVLAGESLAVAVYAVATIGARAWSAPRELQPRGRA